MKTRWPKEVPVLEATDFCRGTLHRGSQHCLLGWGLRDSGLPGSTFIHPKVLKVLECAIKEVYPAYRGECGPAVFNDDKRVSTALLARVWNRAMYLLGYTVGNPEKKTLPEMF